MLGVLLAVLAGAAAFALAYTFFIQTRVSAYALANKDADNYVTHRVKGWYDSWDYRWRAAGFAPQSDSYVGNIAVVVFVAVFGVLFLPFGVVPALGFAAGSVFAFWSYLGRRGLRQEKELEPVIIDFVGALADKVSFMSPREAFVSAVEDSSDVLIVKIFGPAVAELNAGATFGSVLRSVARENPNEAIVEMCAELEAADRSGARTTTSTLSRLRDGLIERDALRREAMSNDVLVKAMKNIFTFAPLVALAISLLIAGPAWNNPIGFGLMAFIVIGTLGANAVFRKLLIWRMDY